MNILFITHETSRTGAPHVILYFIQWIRKYHPQHKIYMVSLKRESISSSFEALCDGFIELEDLKSSQNLGLKKQLLNKAGLLSEKTLKEKWFRIIKNWKINVIHANTVISIPIGAEIKMAFDIKTLIAHVHELEVIIQQKLPNLCKFDEHVSHYITASDLVRDNLIGNHNLPHHKVSRVYECSTPLDSSFKKTAGLNDKIVVGASGTVHWRKGSDLFIQTALQFCKLFPEVTIEFQWLGYCDPNEQLIIEKDLKKARLLDRVYFLGISNEPLEVFKNFDLFLLLSREDPFPLVAIEVGSIGIPIICFEDATGTVEVLKNCGIIVPYLDTTAVALAINYYILNHSLYQAHSNNIKSVFNQFTPDLICPQYYQIITQIENR
ncbi:glycosyltransferase family 4 protein [Nonlabens sp. Ci31]|uniref:glycosyltransferase family 4 protein n=1 Tax=Nonlabens sp. Ci31 TaxID=2608253 RepID=UPI001462A7D7|nr:glycosyltransferase family 4 protein [Nonlabens sp. Ci31]QJP32999.1 glycosyltransferase family 4 protein [Nonlabens sp. Ci31]